MKFALTGNQNCGKTTLFNQLTGSNQHVGNFPGVTVESKNGELLNHKGSFVVDLPGIYSLRPYTQEEIVARDFILDTKPDGLINIVDATNIERNLFLTIQLLSMNKPMVVALNMMDEVRADGGTIDIKKMSEMLGCQVVPISASKNEGVSELVEKALEVAEKNITPTVLDFCEHGSPIHRCIHSVMHLIEDHCERKGISARFCAMNLIITGTDFADRLGLNENEREMLEHIIVEMEHDTGLDRDAEMAEMIYDYIEKVTTLCVKKGHESKSHQRSEKIDKVLTNRHFAIPIFIVIMIGIFLLTFQVIGKYLGDGLDFLISGLGGIVVDACNNYGVNPAVVDFLDKGLFGGLGAVLSLLPYIVVLFLFLSLLEDTGYMARIAFIMDKPLRKIGLSGRSFVPVIVGFGCSVPAIMATRTLSSDRDRKITIGLIPFISCSAKVVVYYGIVNAKVFLWWQQSLIIIGLYLLGIILGIITGIIMSKMMYKGKPVPFVMELPDYRLPSMKSTFLLMWEKAKDFIVRAFTVIFVSTLIVWFLQAYNSKLIFITEEMLANPMADNISLLSHLGNFIAPIMRPIGLEDGRIVSSLIAGFTAKEAVLSTMEMLSNGVGIDALLTTTASALSFLSFVLLYTPCVATVATVKKELGSTWKTILLVVFQCVLAWVVAFIVYNLAVII